MQSPATKRVTRILSLLENTERPTFVFDKVKQQLVQQETELVAKIKECAACHDEIQRLGLYINTLKQETTKNCTTLLDSQRLEFEASIKRQLKLINKLIKEKDELTNNTVQLTSKLVLLDKNCAETINKIKNKHLEETKTQKSIWEQSEKQKRELWMREKTEQIKQSTAKALEPEVQKIISQHKLHLNASQERLREQFNNERIILLESTDKQIQTIRDRIQSERNQSAEEERELARTKYTRMMETAEQEWQLQRRKLNEDWQKRIHLQETEFNNSILLLKQQHESQLNTQSQQFIELQNTQTEQFITLKQSHSTELINSRNESTKLHELNVEEIKNQLRIKFDEEMEKFKQNILIERNKEIEEIINKLEESNGLSLEDKEIQYRSEIENLKEFYLDQSQMKKRELDSAFEKIILMGKTIHEQDEKIFNFQRKLMAIESANESKDGIITELKLQINKPDNKEIEQLKQEIDSQKEGTIKLNTMWQEKVRECEEEKIKTLEMLEFKVKNVIEQKDKAIMKVEQENCELKTKAMQLERMVDKLTNDLFNSSLLPRVNQSEPFQLNTPHHELCLTNKQKPVRTCAKSTAKQESKDKRDTCN